MKKQSVAVLLLVCSLLVVLTGCATAPIQKADVPKPVSQATAEVKTAPPSVEALQESDATTLVVGLYPYVPRLDQFQQVLEAAWAKVQPGVSLKFLTDEEWDGGYSGNPPPEADVFVFDAMLFDYFRAQGFLEPMAAGEIDDLGDFVQYAIDGVEVDGQYYAIPQLGCANILFYLESDTQMAAATTLSEIETALSQCTYTSEIPPDREGLMLDMSGGTTNAALYLDTVNSLTGEYPPPLPWNASQIDSTAMDNMRLLLAMASYENGTASTESYERGEWFGEGWGRALIGFTESMSAMGQGTRERLDFKVMPLSDNDRSSMFYADVIAVNTTTQQRGTRDLAVQLANLMAAQETMVTSIGPTGDVPTPQYLMAARPSIFKALGQSFPIYNEMYALIGANQPLMFNLGKQARQWLSAMKDTIRTEARQDYPCGCDFKASQIILDNAAAPAICNATCADHGGWSGAWTNQSPPAPSGASACGCNTCPAP